MPKKQKHLWPSAYLFPLKVHFKTLNMMCTQSAIHAQPLSESTDEASCICEYQLWQLLVFARTLVTGPESSPAPNMVTINTNTKQEVA